MDSLEAVSKAVEQHVETCNSFRNIWFAVAFIIAGYMVAMGVYVVTTFSDHDKRIEATGARIDVANASLLAAVKEIGAIQLADRKSFQDAMATERQRISEVISSVTNSQIDRTRMAIESVNKSDGNTREELRALRQEIKELREKIEAGMHGRGRP